MNVLAQVIAQREAGRMADDAADDRWIKEHAGIDPDERRALWRRWLRKTLETSLQWPSRPQYRERLIGQCANEITTLARQLRGRGWLLEGPALAAHVKALLDPIGKAQRDGKIGDFWPYFRASVGRYVDAHAEEIRAHARRSGADEATQTVGGVLAALGVGKPKASRTSLTEIIADRDAVVRRERCDRQHADNAQLSLL